MPKVLKLRTDFDSSRDQHLNSLVIIDKELRGSGASAKTPAVFSFHEVSVCNCFDAE